MSITDKVFSFDESSKEEVLQDFNINKADYCINSFLTQHPSATEQDLADFLENARNSYVRARKNGMSDELWLEHLHKYIKTYKFVAPLQRELDKLIHNKNLTDIELEKAELAKQRAEFEKERIEFLNEQSEFIQKGRSKHFEHIVTLSEHEATKKDLELKYYKEIEEIKNKHQEEFIKNQEETKKIFDEEVNNLKDFYDRKIEKISDYYNKLKEKVVQLKEENAKLVGEIYERDVTTENQIALRTRDYYEEIEKIKKVLRNYEILSFELKSKVKEKDYLLNQLRAKIKHKDEEFKKFIQDQPEIVNQLINDGIKQGVKVKFSQLESKLKEQVEKYEDTVGKTYEKHKNEVDKILIANEAKIEVMKNALLQAEETAKLTTNEIERIKSEYDLIVYTNRELNEAIKLEQEKNKELLAKVEALTAENNDLDKLNNLLVKKYNDNDHLLSVSKSISEQLDKINASQRSLQKVLSTSNDDITNKKILDLDKEINAVNETYKQSKNIKNEPIELPKKAPTSGKIIEYIEDDEELDSQWAKQFSEVTKKIKEKKNNKKKRQLLDKKISDFKE
ncbi:hypothetical protein [Mycoplasma bradburyae]|uniref:Uncharacterized protein n=1 Tax=Mycoplasma bradburyae TaxID=2963128 RepID=A0AAW6HS21_9MOLU|nr:hypothetical protein [Mycoplasma bradburyae]MDC4163369.1 hypothetical protein [Mycoplasma bradburyae]MDC4181983.1 hypothetical protein [Mycoplasma bradburyae]MDC4183358.1 hypothetical protein [Mycoplasma bradburyae]MDC4184166.1 hypothetical protein [Mycoplasma bradburyae]UTS70408.1 hypothetical protein NMG68_01565 [Mycoplasma bradburyae]